MKHCDADSKSEEINLQNKIYISVNFENLFILEK